MPNPTRGNKIRFEANNKRMKIIVIPTNLDNYYTI